VGIQVKAANTLLKPNEARWALLQGKKKEKDGGQEVMASASRTENRGKQ